MNFLKTQPIIAFIKDQGAKNMNILTRTNDEGKKTRSFQLDNGVSGAVSKKIEELNASLFVSQIEDVNAETGEITRKFMLHPARTGEVTDTFSI
jgi:hypothetical protein